MRLTAKISEFNNSYSQTNRKTKQNKTKVFAKYQVFVLDLYDYPFVRFVRPHKTIIVIKLTNLIATHYTRDKLHSNCKLLTTEMVRDTLQLVV